MKSIVPGRQVWAVDDLIKVDNKCGGLRPCYRKNDRGFVISRSRPTKCWVQFDCAYSAAGYKMPSSWHDRRTLVTYDLITTRDPHPPKMENESVLLSKIRTLRATAPSLTAKELHARIIEMEPVAELDFASVTLAAVKRCLQLLQKEKRCPIVHQQGAADVLEPISEALPLDSFLSLTATCKSMRAMLEETRLKRTGDIIERHFQSVIYGYPPR